MEGKNPILASTDMCTGCMACYNICPVQAISCIENNNGFLYPTIDNTKCIKCLQCEKACPVLNNHENFNVPIKAFAGNTEDSELSEASSSGGIFAEIAKQILSSCGVVYGAEMQFTNGKVAVIHSRIDDEKDLYRLQGSKYVQSNISDSFKLVHNDLKNRKLVLFSGTPCQIAGLYSYLNAKNIDLTNLYTIDIICHGVPSQALFQEYLNFLSKKYHDNIEAFIFRSKVKGWGPLIAEIKLTSGTNNYINYTKSSYYSFFLSGYAYRTSCYHCKYAGMERTGDLTIGDYWGVQKEEQFAISNGKLNTQKGISCIFVNSKKGISLLKDYGENLNLKQTAEIKIATHNSQLIKPSNNKVIRSKFILSKFRTNYILLDFLHKVIPFIL